MRGHAEASLSTSCSGAGHDRRSRLAGCALVVAVMAASPDGHRQPLDRIARKRRELAGREVAAVSTRASMRPSFATTRPTGRSARCARPSARTDDRQRLTRYELDVAQTALSTRAVALYKHGDITRSTSCSSADDFGDLVAPDHDGATGARAATARWCGQSLGRSERARRCRRPRWPRTCAPPRGSSRSAATRSASIREQLGQRQRVARRHPRARSACWPPSRRWPPSNEACREPTRQPSGGSGG